ncbi:hypothetical protein BKA69DRAFT_313803 [Paraphysoderma sedebokerense]|nr:hypothetical protein BKA69DRAFT_313803 [Paraphysoderma sedebokerense]
MLRLEDYSELPPFANERNRKLDAEIKAKEARLALLEAQLEDNSSRTGSMLEHMKNVQQELVHIQNLQDARNREIETEEHFKTLAEREIERYVSEMKLLEKETIEISDKASGVQNSIYRTNEKVSKLRGLLASEQKELDEWLKVQTEKEEDNLVILKYSKEDDVRIKELSVQIEKLMTEVNKKKNQLNQEMAETQVSQIELERTTEAFKKIHEERQMLLQQWEAAINTMKERDESIMKAQEQYQKLKKSEKNKPLLTRSNDSWTTKLAITVKLRKKFNCLIDRLAS